MAYGLYLYKEITTKGKRTVKLEIWQKDFSGSSAEIEAMGVSPFTLSIDNSGGNVEEPLIKTNLNIVIKDTSQVDYDIFFTPDATKFKVILKVSGVDYWVGYLTPDSYSESLSFRSDIVLTARDNLGMLSELKYERAGKRATMRTLINEAMSLISFGNTLEYRQKKTSGTLNILDAYIRSDRFIGKTWADVVQTILHDCGLQMRFVGAAKYAIYDIGEIVNLGTTISTQTFKFINSSGQREIVPAARTISLDQDYGSVDNSYDGVLADSDYSFRAARSVSQPLTKDISTPQVFTINYYDPFSIVWAGAGGSIGIVNPNEWSEAPSTIMLTGDLYTFTNYRPAIYYSQIMPVTAGNVEVAFQVSNLVKYPTTSGSDYVWKDYFFEYIKDPSSSLVEWFGAKYQVKFRCNIFLQGATKTYVMREKWEEYIDEGPTATAKYLTFVLPSGGNAGEFPNLWEYNAKDEELKFNIQTIPEDGTLRIAFYPYELVGKFVQTYPSVEPQDIKDNIPLTYPVLVKNISIKYPAVEVGGLESSAIINASHNVAYNIDLELGQVPQGIGDSATLYGGIFNNGANFYKALGNFFVTSGVEYHLSELIGREIANIYKEQREKLSGTIISDVNFSALPSFGKTFTDGTKYYALNSGSLDFISEQMEVEMIEVEPYLYEDFTFVAATVESTGGVSIGSGEKTFTQWSSAGNAKRIYQLDTASPEERNASFVMVDKSGLSEARKVDLFSYLDQKENLLPATPSDPEQKFLNGNREWSLINLGSNGNSPRVFFTSIASDVATYKELSYTPEATTSYCSTSITNAEVLCSTFLYPLGVGVESLDAGTWEFEFFAKVSGTAGSLTMKAEVFKRSAAGVETTLFSKYSDVINNTTYKFIPIQYTSVAIPVSATDRIGVRVYGKNTIAAAITLSWAVGDGDASYFVTPLNMRHAQLRGKNDEAGFQHITEAAQTFSGNKTFSNDVTALELISTRLRIPTGTPSGLALDKWYLYADATGFSGEVPSGGAITDLYSLTDVALTGITSSLPAGQILLTNGTKWANVTASTTNITEGTNLYYTNARVKTYADTLYIPITEKGAALGVTPLDSGGKVALQYLPSTLLKYMGVWNASTNSPTLTSPDTDRKGQVWNVSVAGTQFGIAFKLGDWLIYNDSGVAEKSDNSDDVTSVNGFTGAVTLKTSNIAEETNLYYTDARVKSYSDLNYLGINAKAADSDKLDNLDSDSYFKISSLPSSDVNFYTYPIKIGTSFYSGGNGTGNSNEPFAYGQIIELGNRLGSYGHSVLLGLSSDNKIYYNNCYLYNGSGGGFSGWREMYHTANSNLNSVDWTAQELISTRLRIPEGTPSGLTENKWYLYADATGFSGEVPSGSVITDMYSLTDTEFSAVMPSAGKMIRSNGTKWVDVTPTTAMIAEDTNLYYTNARVKAYADTLYEPIFSKNTAFNKNFGTSAGSVCEGNDTRLSDARTPLSHTHDDRYYTETESDNRFLGITSKAADSNKLDGQDSTYFATAAQLNASNLSNGYLPYWNGSSLVNSVLYQSGNSIGIGTSVPAVYGGIVALTIGDNSSTKQGLLKFRSSYNSGNGAELWQNNSGLFFHNINGSTTAYTIQPNGNVGIGYTDRTEKLAVNGSGYFNGNFTIDGVTSAQELMYKRNGSLRWNVISYEPELGGNTGSNYHIYRYGDNGGYLDIALAITRANGNVGIGYTDRNEKLAVFGNIYANSYIETASYLKGTSLQLSGAITGATTITMGENINTRLRIPKLSGTPTGLTNNEYYLFIQT